MDVRKFREEDTPAVVALFYDTVHTVNKRDYTQEQLDVWAPTAERALRGDAWRQSLLRNITYVAVKDGTIVGFADMTRHGYVDRLYVHKDFQRQGIAAALYRVLEIEARALALTRLHVEASITARPFFEQCGFHIVRSQTVERQGVGLTNYRMVKPLD